MLQPTKLRRRASAALVVLAVLAVPQLVAPIASGDRVVDKRVEAQRISTRLDSLQERVEILSEAYDTAQIRLVQVRRQVVAARQALRRTEREIAKRRSELVRYAVNAYTSGGDDGTLEFVLRGDGAGLGARKGYATIAVGDKADLVDALRAAKADGDATVADLRRAQKRADAVQSNAQKQRKAAAAAVKEAQQTYARVQGELKTLVAAEQARQAAAQQARAVAVARTAAVRAHVAAPPAAGPSTTGQAQPVRVPSARSSGAVSAPPAPAAPAAPVGQGAAAAIAAARSVLGVRYTWSGASPSSGFDCSGLVMWAWAHGGKSLPHSSAAQYGMARRIPLSALQPGDLVFYGSPVHHVALYIGGGQIIHAPHTGSYVQVASMYYWSDLVGAGRV